LQTFAKINWKFCNFAKFCKIAKLKILQFCNFAILQFCNFAILQSQWLDCLKPRFLDASVCRSGFSILSGIGSSQLVRTSRAWRRGEISYISPARFTRIQGYGTMKELEIAVFDTAKGLPCFLLLALFFRINDIFHLLSLWIICSHTQCRNILNWMSIESNWTRRLKLFREIIMANAFAEVWWTSFQHPGWLSTQREPLPRTNGLHRTSRNGKQHTTRIIGSAKNIIFLSTSEGCYSRWWRSVIATMRSNSLKSHVDPPFTPWSVKNTWRIAWYFCGTSSWDVVPHASSTRR